MRHLRSSATAVLFLSWMVASTMSGPPAWAEHGVNTKNDASAPVVWFDSGHRVVAILAWEQMSDATRIAVTDLLRSAPEDADLPGREPRSETSDPDRALFIEASTWADRVRDQDHPERRQRYHRGRWHYVNNFWVAEGEPAGPLEEWTSSPENATRKLIEFLRTVADSSVSENERAIQLAWIIHLVGDLHQPLHASSRITTTEPSGDRGGGLFPLREEDDLDNLHVYWDGILDLSYPRREGEDVLSYADRLRHHVGTGDSKDGRLSQIDSARVDSAGVVRWMEESSDIAQRAVYLPLLDRGETPSPRYQRHALRLSEARLRAAGAQLAALLNDRFDPRS